jgi:hypothetical protein
VDVDARPLCGVAERSQRGDQMAHDNGRQDYDGGDHQWPEPVEPGMFATAAVPTDAGSNRR